MAVYTQFKNEDIRKIVSVYGLEVLNFAAIEGGACNSNFRLNTPQGKFVLTIFEERELQDITRVADLLLWLKKYHYPTTRLLLTNAGEVTAAYKNKPVIMKYHIAGRVCSNPGVAKLEQIGVALGELHRLSVPDYLPEIHYYEHPVFAEVIGKDIDPEYESWLSRRLATLNKTLPKNVPRGLIHGDLFSDNVLFNGSQLQAIIDFEEACCFYKIFDLGMAIIGLCTEENTIRLEKAQALVNGYQRVRKLEENEKKSLHLFTEYAAVKTSNWRFWKYHIAAPGTNNVNKHWEMVHLAEEVRAVSEAQFLQVVT